MRKRLSFVVTLVTMVLFAGWARAGEPLPPATGPIEPRATPRLGDDGLYHPDWFVASFLDLRDDHAEARAAGKRFAVIFEQRGCVYCTKMHTEVLSQRYINDYVRQNFAVVQLDLWGSREVTDFDGAKMPEKKLAERWGIAFTPTVVFFKDDLSPFAGRWGRALEAVERLPLAFGAPTFYDLFVFVRAGIYRFEPSFQRFHIARMAEREQAGSR